MKKKTVGTLCVVFLTMISQSACSAESGASNDPQQTTIDERTFDFTIPSMNPPPENIPKDFIVGALNTPSPPPEIYKTYGKLLYEEGVLPFIKDYLANRPPATDDEITNLVQRTRENMIFVKGGTFEMGDFGYLTKAKRPMSDSMLDDPPHKVTLDSYSLMKNRITYADYDLYTRSENLALVGQEPTALTMRFPDFPAVVSWRQARNYCVWLKKKTGEPFDIDTSAQYEYAARSRGKWLYLASTFQDEKELLPNMNEFATLMTKQEKNVTPNATFGVPVGTYGHNHLGFEDMIGLTKEWVYDWFAPYTDSPKTNPRGPNNGQKKVVKLGNYSYNGTISRGRLDPDKPYGTFRCAINAGTPWK